MVVLLSFSFLAGVVTVLSPCVLPLLPVLLSGTAGRGRARPWGIISGFVLSFTIFTLSFSALIGAFGLHPDFLRWTAAVVILLFGLVMVVPVLKDGFMSLVSRLMSFASARGSAAAPKKEGGAYWSGLLLGTSLGLVWTPCVGPIMASVITLALTQSVDFGSVLITLAYSLGTALPLSLILLGGRSLLNKVPFLSKHSAGIQRGFGLLMVFTAIAVFNGWDRDLQTALLTAFPDYGTGLTALEEQDGVLKALEAREAGE